MKKKDNKDNFTIKYGEKTSRLPFLIFIDFSKLLSRPILVIMGEGERSLKLYFCAQLNSISDILIALDLLYCLVVQLVKRLPARQETWVQYLGMEDPLEKEMATHSSILAWITPYIEKPGGLHKWGHKESDTTEWLSLHLYFISHLFVRGFILWAYFIQCVILVIHDFMHCNIFDIMTIAVKGRRYVWAKISSNFF